MSWRPHLPDGDTPAYLRLVDALAADVAAGALAPGQRLPTHRRLAEDLALGVGTITRAYAEAEARGLITARVGAGSFVADALALPGATTDTAGGPVDLARNLPPMAPAEAALARSLPRLARRADLAACLAYAPNAGLDGARRAGAAWIARTANWDGASAERVICTSGAHQAIASAILTVCRPGDALIVERATFYGVRLLAGRVGLRLIAADMDGEGLTPDGLARAAQDSGARAAYVLPLQNPTGRLMGAARRREIAETARRLDLSLVEDDLFAGHVTDLGLAPIAAHAPERTFYASGLSKAVAPGLRTGYLVPPASAFDRSLESLRALAFGAPTFGNAIATDWIERGEAFQVQAEVTAELAARLELARRIFGPAMEPMTRPASSHVWLPMSELDAERVAGQALRQGVEVTSPRPPFLPGIPVDGLRVCLGGPADRNALARALEVVRAAVQDAPQTAAAFV
ncbi:PLP-dependent aminotransferase family protein [Caulobacter sp. KR2-114]|uniref:aminotransferase-like domain-containing protein n=1 Tax=Caulobacter sp. KR2-114 TaxID=3400912 RepID=UPI003BFCE917